MQFDGVHIHGIGANPITIWDGNAIRRLSAGDTESLKNILDVFGKRSAKAQGLGAPITDIYRLRSTDQRLYLYATRNPGGTVVMGGLKIGSKKLFVRTDDGQLQEIEPTCVLDFYVDESYQRKGIGKELFEAFLATEQLLPAQVAYDRPSPKLIGFLRKHYGLADYIPQNNNFVVFNQYWQLVAPKPQRNRQHLGSATARPSHSSRQQAPAGSPMHKTQPITPSPPLYTVNSGGARDMGHGLHSTGPASPHPQGFAMAPGATDSPHSAAPMYTSMRTNFSVPYGSPGAGGHSNPYGPDSSSSCAGEPGDGSSYAAASALPPQNTPGPGFGQRWPQHNGGGNPGPLDVAPQQPLPAGLRRPLDSLDNFREEAAHRALMASSRANPNTAPGPVPGASVHTAAGPAYAYSPVVAHGVYVPGLGTPPLHPLTGGTPPPPGSSSRAYVRPPWGTDEQLSMSPMPPHACAPRHGAADSGGKAGPGMNLAGQFSGMSLHQHHHGRLSGEQLTPPPQRIHHDLQQGQGTPGGEQARNAALAARSGSGAASCLIMT